MDRAVGSGTTSLLGGDGIGGQDDERADTMSGGSGDDGLGGGSGDDDLIGAAGEDIADGDGDVDFCDAETETLCEL